MEKSIIERARGIMGEIGAMQEQYRNKQITPDIVESIREEIRDIYDSAGLKDIQFWMNLNDETKSVEMGFPRVIDIMAAEGIRLLASLPTNKELQDYESNRV